MKCSSSTMEHFPSDVWMVLDGSGWFRMVLDGSSWVSVCWIRVRSLEVDVVNLDVLQKIPVSVVGLISDLKVEDQPDQICSESIHESSSGPCSVICRGFTSSTV